jgi:aldehyde dehydrogenase (NAD+)
MTSIDVARSALGLRLRERYDLFIHGEWRAPTSHEWITASDPANGNVLSEFARGTAPDVAQAVDDAHAAFGVWRTMRPAERSRILIRIAQAIRDVGEDLAVLETLDNGKPLAQARTDVETAARYFEFFGGAADKLYGESIPFGPDYLIYTRREPYGVVGAILPWNSPVNQAARAIAPALAAGNSVVAKPAEDTSLSCLVLAELMVHNGLPPGVVNVVTGYGPEAGQPMMELDLIRRVAFTGSVATGRRLLRASADRLIPLTLELGGKSANLVFDDADLAAAARNTVSAINTNAGQICSAPSRLLVQASVHEELLERMVDLGRQVTIGPGIEDPDIGAITTEAQFEKVQDYLRVGRAEGARVVTGGDAVRDGRLQQGRFIAPTIFSEVTSSMRIAREEIFGPVISVLRFQTEADAIAMANASEFGLAAGVWSRDISRVHRVAAELEAGQVFANEWFAGGVETPFGGYKSSGFGREKGLEALSHYTQVKSVNVRL